MEGLMKRGPDFSCLKDHAAFIFGNVLLVGPVLLLFLVSPVDAQEKVFTDADLSSYKSEPMVDEQTAASMQEDVNLYVKMKDAELLRDREKREKQRAAEMKRAASQKQDVAVTRSPVSSQNNVYSSGVIYKSGAGGKRRT